jgi:K+-transporting ATPase ATPase C chain
MRHLTTAVLLFLALTVLTGLIYPLAVTGLGQVLFPRQANGSVIEMNGKVIGSELIGQPFSDPGYFWGRPSATAPFPGNAASSSGSNLGPTNPALFTRVRTDAARLGGRGPIPADLVTTSASGLDPHISPEAALYQVARVARARGLEPSVVRSLVESHIEGRTFGVLGEPRVNVLRLNLALDALKEPRG